MFCPTCGKSIPTETASARFCSNCGARLVFDAPLPASGKLIRPRYPRMIAGVCAGFAELYGWDLSLVRFATVMLTLVTGGIVLLAYVALWIILPEAPYTLPNTTGMPTA